MKNFIANFFIVALVFSFGMFVGSAVETSTADHYVCPELRDAVDQFYVEAKSRGFDIPSKGLTVVLGEFEDKDSTSSIAGYSYGHRTIWISRPLVASYIADDSPLDLEYVVFHELGHSLLGRGHAGGMSIMNAYL